MGCTCSIPTGSSRRSRSSRSSSLPTVAHAPDRKEIIHGLEHTCSDDALWIVVSICEYVKETGELELFDEVVPFADEGEATVYEHLKRALDFSAEQVGATGICKGLRADWNDCLNLGGGESAMVSFMHHWALRAFVEAAQHLGREDDAANVLSDGRESESGLRARTLGRRVVSARHHGKGAEGRQPRERRRQDLHREQHLGGAVGCGVARARTRGNGRGGQVPLLGVRHPSALAGLLQAQRRHRLRWARLQGHQGERARSSATPTRGR